jgi:CheY-like chemotaxis protein
MARILVVDDDPGQLELRKIILERSGHSVQAAADVQTARKMFAKSKPEAVVLDLRLPDTEDGLALVREFTGKTKVLVLSGAVEGMEGRPELKMIDELLGKPIRSESLLRTITRLITGAMLTFPLLASDAQVFRVSTPAETIAEVELSGKPGDLAEVRVDGVFTAHINTFLGGRRHVYPTFLGKLGYGEHRISVTGAELHSIKFQQGDPSGVVALAPVLFARENTIGKFTDVPLMVYAERIQENGQPVLQYTVIFSNEDGGTSTRALMARWGRTTDIEYVYKAYLKPDGALSRATIQSRGHEEIEYGGKYFGTHPMLIPVTDNNMVSGETSSSVRYQIAPVMVDLARTSREQVMDDRPWLYEVATEELKREEKLRPFGVIDAQKISDPRNYLYIEANVTNRDAGIAALVRLKNESRVRSSHLGREDYAIERSGWVRTTVELPPGTRPDQIAEIGFTCLVVRPARNQPLPVSGTCLVNRVNKAFFLGADYQPGAAVWRMEKPSAITSGESVMFAP